MSYSAIITLFIIETNDYIYSLTQRHKLKVRKTMGKYKGFFTLEEWRKQTLPKLVQDCRKELLEKGILGKKGARVDRDKLLACVREKAKQLKQEKMKELASKSK